LVVEVSRAGAYGLATGVACGSLAAAALTAVLVATNLSHSPQWPAVFLGILPLALVYSIAGALIARRQPRNPIGWLFLLISTDYSLTALADAYAGVDRRLDRRPRTCDEQRHYRRSRER